MINVEIKISLSCTQILETFRNTGSGSNEAISDRRRSGYFDSLGN